MITIDDNLNEAVKRLEAQQLTSRELEKVLHKLLVRVLSSARRSLSEDARSIIGKGFSNSNGDPRSAYKAVKYMTYRQVLGGNVSILTRKRRSKDAAIIPSSSRAEMRSTKTKRMLSYGGTDRGFILRFINSGTDNRVVQGINNHSIGEVKRNPKRKYKGGIGNRGSISARNWFPGAGQKAMEKAAGQFAALIEKEIEKLSK